MSSKKYFGIYGIRIEQNGLMWVRRKSMQLLASTVRSHPKTKNRHKRLLDTAIKQTDRSAFKYVLE